MLDASDADRRLRTLEELLAIDAAGLEAALTRTSDLVALAVNADKVDVFLYQASSGSLVAVGTSRTPMGVEQHRRGMDRLPLVNGGRVVEAFTHERSYMTGRAELDPTELRGIVEGLGVRSSLLAPLYVGTELRGVLSAVSATPDRFADQDLGFLQAAAGWIGMVTHRAELSQELADQAAEQARRTTADELIRVLAHDLRNHLTPLHARVELLRRWATSEQQETPLHHARELSRSIDRLGRLVADLLDSARLEQGLLALDPEPTDLVQLADEVAALLRTEAQPIVTRAAGTEVCVLADRSRIQQVLENLLSNAITYSPPGAAVTVEVRTQAQSGGRWGQISVQDEGPGIPPELKPRVFERFVTGSGSTGLGLGLYLARNITEAQGGRLTLEPCAHGARFTVALPLSEPD
ncbi:MAG: GAF domain-containing sensor histidine kinase [Chloroflexi bacterium]|nr:GAF domain-containing sensor histidine kinase [Chloroflexota bacterium]